MSRRLIDLTGSRFGRLTVLERQGTYYHRYSCGSVDSRPIWLCRCDCGKTVLVQGHNLHSGGTRSCGCLRVDRAKEVGHARKGRKRKGAGP